MKNYSTRLLTLFFILISVTANASTDFSLLGVNFSLSGFATAGFAISDQPYKYQRFINNDGTFKRDSLAGAQLDIKFNNEFSITTQAKIATSAANDKDVVPDLTWAFLSWRPTNDLLFRAGRVRVPLYLKSQSMDIGTTVDFARLPSEVYATATTNNIDGISASKTWGFSEGELTLDGYVGTTNSYFRKSAFSFAPISAQAEFFPIRMNSYGAALTFQDDDNTFRISAHDSYTSCTNCTKGNYFRVDFPYVQIMPGVGYYKVSNQMPGANLPEVEVVHTPVYTAAADVSLGYGFRLTGEYVRRNVRNIAVGVDSQGGYVALLKSFDEWTPYISMAFLQSMDKTMDIYNKVSQNVIPAMIPGSATLNATQRAGASSIPAYDQKTWAIGTSYRLSSTSKLKAEWAITDTGNVSSFVDAPPNEYSGHRLIDVFSLSYNIVF